MISLQLTERELDLIIDATVTRHEGLIDVQLFSINPLAVKLRINELQKLIDRVREEKVQYHEN